MKAAMRLDDDGAEVMDPRPVEWPLNLKRPLSLQEEIKRFVRAELSQAAAADGFESFEDADDFEVEDEEEWSSPYELTEMQADAPPPPAEPLLTSAPDVSKSVSNKTIPDKAGSVSSTAPPPSDDVAAQQG